MAGFGTAWRDSAAVLDIYRALWSARDQPSGIASRYSPIPQYQVAFRNHKAYGELEELVGLLRDRLQGRPVELVFPAFDGLALYPELLYFFGEFRSVSGITAKESSVWLKSDDDAWIAKVLASRTACVFFDFEVAVQPDVRSMAALGTGLRGGCHAADRRQAQLRGAVL